MITDNKLNYISCRWDNMVGYSTEYWCGALKTKDYRQYMTKAIEDCDRKTLLWLARTIMSHGDKP